MLSSKNVTGETALDLISLASNGSPIIAIPVYSSDYFSPGTSGAGKFAELGVTAIVDSLNIKAPGNVS